mgnify:CR=1 FL=1
MNIVYVAIEKWGANVGVSQKILAQLSFLNKMGHEAKGIFASYHYDLQKPYELTCEGLIWNLAVRTKKGLHAKSLNRRRVFQALTEILETEPYHVIYMRYPLYLDLALNRFLKRHKGRVVFENQSMEPAEMWTRKQYLKYLLEKLLAKSVYKKLKGCVAVTPEIAAYQRKKASRPDMPVAAICNGIHVNRLPLKQEVPISGKQIELVMVASFFPHHGLDRLLKGLIQYKGSHRVRLHLAGDTTMFGDYSNWKRSLGDRVVDHGRLEGSELDRLFDRVHFAIGSLGIHRINGLRQATPLKTREYIARGIPFAIGYEDADLPRNNEIEDLYMECPQTENPIDIDHLVSGILGIYKEKEIQGRLRWFAETKLDWSHKVHELSLFLKQL